MGKLKYVVPSIEDFKMDSYLQAPHLIHLSESRPFQKNNKEGLQLM